MYQSRCPHILPLNLYFFKLMMKCIQPKTTLGLQCIIHKTHHSTASPIHMNFRMLFILILQYQYFYTALSFKPYLSTDLRKTNILKIMFLGHPFPKLLLSSKACWLQGSRPSRLGHPEGSIEACSSGLAEGHRF